jgi:phospholipid N-methyltransferase
MRRRMLRSKFLFTRSFLRHPLRTGSLVPSSRFLVKRMLSRIDWQHARVLVELGPGLGCFTKEIVRRMRPDAVLIAIEMNSTFARILRHKVRDHRLFVVEGSALHLDTILARLEFGAADCIVSGLPFANMDNTTRESILRKCREVLSCRGQLVLFQYRLLLLPALAGIFRSVERSYEPLNIPPAHIFCCTRE